MSNMQTTERDNTKTAFVLEREALYSCREEAEFKDLPLAIYAKLLNIEEVLKFQREGKDIWIHLCRELDIDLSKRATAIPLLKEAVNSICEGSSLFELFISSKAYLTKNNISIGFDKLNNIAIIQSIKNARKEALLKISKEKGAITDSGKKLTLGTKSGTYTDSAILSLMIRDLQEQLVQPLYRLAHSTIEFTLTLSRPNKVIIDFFGDTQAYWETEIQQVVSAEARTMGVITSLEYHNAVIIATKSPLYSGWPKFADSDKKPDIKCQSLQKAA